MKRNIFRPRYYSLLKNFGSYKSSNYLIGSWSFWSSDITASKSYFMSETAVSASLKNTAGVDYQAPPWLFETPSFLKGENFINKATLTIDNTAASNADKLAGLEVSGFPEVPQAIPPGSGNSRAFTMSMTFQIPQAGSRPLGALPAEDAKISIMSISDHEALNGRVGVYYDNDGGGAGTPAIIVVVAEDDGFGGDTKTFIIGFQNAASHPRWSSAKNVRDWIRLDLVFTDITKVNQADFLVTTGATAYINGLPAPAGTTPVTSLTMEGDGYLTKSLFGGVLTKFSSLVTTNRIRIGEFAIWSAPLSNNEINEIYNRQNYSENSGVVSNPARIGDACGECDHDEYPTIARAVDQRRLGVRTPAFSDLEEVTDLPRVGSKINYPTLLQSGSSAASAVGTLIPTPNTLPTLYGTASYTGSQGRANIINSYKNCGNYTNFSDTYTPFNDTQAPVDIGTQTAWMQDEAPGFSRLLGNRIIIDVDIGTGNDRTLRIVSGNQGETFGEWGKVNKSAEGTTGLYYYNFTNRSLSPVGAHKFETSERTNWFAQPGQMSSSYNNAYMVNEYKIAYPAGPNYLVGDFGFWTDVGGADMWYRTQTAHYDDWSKIPRIFQPYPATVAHRGTFHKIHGPFDFSPGKYPAGKTMAIVGFDVTPTGMTHLRTALTGAWDFPADFENAGIHDWVGVQGYEYGGGPYDPTVACNTDREYIAYSNDIAGPGWVSVLQGRDGIDPFNQKWSRIWNNPSDLTGAYGSELSENFEYTFASTGRPISYTNWSTSALFHATSSNLLKMSDYITSPILLEAFEVVDVEAEVTRRQNPYVGYQSKFAAPHEEIVRKFSNYNNHIDLLTFFLLRQNSSNPGAKTARMRETATERELISFSHHVFASPYVGWDWWDSTKMGPIILTQSFNSIPLAGARMSRVFEVNEDILRRNIPGVDSVQFYKNSDGTDIKSHGNKGVFGARDPFGSYSPTTRLPGATTFPIGDLIVSQSMHPSASVFVTSSLKLPSIKAPVRIVSAFAQKTTPVLPSNQSVVPMANIQVYMPSPFFGTGPYTPPYRTAATGSEWNAHFHTHPLGNVNTEFFFRNGQAGIVTPRPHLACMGVSWPGGTKSRKLEIPTLMQLYSASFGLGTPPEASYAVRTNKWTVPENFLPIGMPSSSDGYAGPHDAQKFYASEIQGAAQIAEIKAIDTRTFVKEAGYLADPRKNLGYNRVDGSEFEWLNSFTLPIKGSIIPGSHYFIEQFAKSKFTMDNGTFASLPIAAGQTQRVQQFPRQRMLTTPHFSGPFAVYTSLTGSLVKNSGYLLTPQDELIFGMQWSPADAVHRSFAAIYTGSLALSFATSSNDVTGSMVPPNDGPFSPPSDQDEDLCMNLTAPQAGQHAYRAAGFCQSNDLTNNAYAECTIKSRPMKLRLYGSQLQNLEQKNDSLPQQLTTVCVHEVIGNEPILDQFDMAETHEIITSTFAKQISGSMKPGTFDGDRSFSKSSLPLDRARGVRRQLGFGRDTLTDIGCIKRVLRMADVAEYYYDSIVPRVSTMFARDGADKMLVTGSLGLLKGGTITDEANYRRTVYIIGATPYWNQPLSAGTTSAEFLYKNYKNVNAQWARSFPFEPRYSKIPRVFNQSAVAGYHYTTRAEYMPLMYSQSCDSTGATSTVWDRDGWVAGGTVDFLTSDLNKSWIYHGQFMGTPINGMVLPVTCETVEQFIIKEDKLVKVGPGGSVGKFASVRSDFSVGRHSVQGPKIHRRVNTRFPPSGSLVPFFGVGDNWRGTLDADFYYLSCSAGSADASVQEGRICARKPRGWKYGLVSAIPTRVTSVFRRDRYGQFRDMLEQRPLTKLYIRPPGDIKSEYPEIKKFQGPPKKTVSAVSCRFRQAVFENPNASSKTVRVPPADTQSSNLSVEASSSIPYFDGVLTNRDSAPTSDSEEIVIT